MPDRTSSEITAMLRAWSNGTPDCADQLFPLIYDELRRQAHRFLLRERVGHTLQTTALINETYIRLRQQPGFQWESRGHFFAICATMMRRILVDHAKTRHRAKRGGVTEHIPLDEIVIAIKDSTDVDVIVLNDALERLAKLDPQQARIVELKFFSGFGTDEIADLMGLSDSTVKRDWRAAKAWLRYELDKGGAR
jgi:RNA polymerase sigma-70 factor (ECF subfamily)